MTKKKLTALATLLALQPFAALGQEAEMKSHVFSGGGGTGSGGGYVISGTIGQGIGGGAMSGGDYELRGGFHAATLEVIPPEPDESFQLWMDGLSGEDRPPEDQRGPSDEPAGDGMSNLLKYALGLMPMTPSAAAAPRVVVVSVDAGGGTEEDFLAIEFERSTEAAVKMDLYGSDDLSGWAPVWFVTEVVDPSAGENRERVRLVTDIPVADHSEHFLRLYIETQ